ncbi:MAG: four helix bundle protein [Parachlamydiaceae bacterium]
MEKVPLSSCFDHEKLNVYNSSIELVAVIDEIVKDLPRGRAYLTDQILRAGTSVPLNIAEGAGEFAINEKIRFYRIAKRSATECSAILDVCRTLNLIKVELLDRCKALLFAIVSMLTKLAKAAEK